MNGELRGRRCLVTGAAGFIGSALCRALTAAGAEVDAALRPGGRRLPDPPPVRRAHEADLRRAPAVRRLVRSSRPELVFHAAVHPARGYGGPLSEAVADDLLAVAHLLDAVAGTGLLRFVHLGSAFEYGTGARPLREDAPPRPSNLRGALKAAATHLVLASGGSRGVPAVVIRPFHVYGPGEEPDRLVPAAIRAALRGEPLPLAEPRFERDPVFVDDLAAACLAAAVIPAAVGEAINCGTGRGVSNRELVAAVEAAAGRPIAVEPGAYPARATDVGRRVADVAKARRLLGWRPAHDLAAGLAETVAWWRTRPAEAVAAAGGGR